MIHVVKLNRAVVPFREMLLNVELESSHGHRFRRSIESEFQAIHSLRRNRDILLRHLAKLLREAEIHHTFFKTFNRLAGGRCRY